MDENPNCTLCVLSSSAHPRSVCLKGEGSGIAQLVIFMDAPSLVEDRRHHSFVSDGAALLKWMLNRMSVNINHVYFDYILKCYPGKCREYSKKAYRLNFIEACSTYRVATLQHIRPRAVIGMGSKCCEAFLGSDKVALYEGTDWTPMEPMMRDYVDKVFITYSPAYALEDAAESVSIYRTLWAAAEKAGLKPRFNKYLKAFDYGI